MRRPLLLSGFMATGKSTVGRLLAERTGRPFVDLDARLAARLGSTIPEYFARAGEASFRAEEQAELRRVLAGPGDAPAPVVALGGGALLNRDVRLEALDQAVVVTLAASAAEVARRAGHRSGRPLLDAPNPEQRALELLAQRAVAYAEAHAVVRTDGQSPDAVAERVLGVWRRDAIAVAAGEQSYAVEVGRHLVASRLGELAGHATAALLVTDGNVGPLHGDATRRALASPARSLSEFTLPPGEREKHIGSIEAVWRAALGAGLDRQSVFVGLGGGVVTDMTGFAAATFLRGVRWVGVPTTLLAMVDASVGGKTGVDLLQAKNAVGAFWQPSGVLCDTDLEATEPARGYVSALAEVVKTALIGDPGLFELMETELTGVRARDPELTAELVRRSVRVKARVVGLDEREGGLRAVLNLGHTLGHALEAQAGFERLSHGEAVSLGLVAALRLGERLGTTPPALRERCVRLLENVGLPTDLAAEPLE
ncbi:MAG TPA: bifunctional shikimate kinase/3-dehydroquinate synthase, partial [Polyangiaceae bacterium]|nr:bifunctional shikimate kinase/3-dehydroquinate synthase [Polyangiaceae bacterium]